MLKRSAKWKTDVLKAIYRTTFKFCIEFLKYKKTQDNIIPEGDRNRLTTGCLENMEIFYIVNSIYKQITD